MPRQNKFIESLSGIKSTQSAFESALTKRQYLKAEDERVVLAQLPLLNQVSSQVWSKYLESYLNTMQFLDDSHFYRVYLAIVLVVGLSQDKNEQAVLLEQPDSKFVSELITQFPSTLLERYTYAPGAVTTFLLESLRS